MRLLGGSRSIAGIRVKRWMRWERRKISRGQRFLEAEKRGVMDEEQLLRRVAACRLHSGARQNWAGVWWLSCSTRRAARWDRQILPTAATCSSPNPSLHVGTDRGASHHTAPAEALRRYSSLGRLEWVMLADCIRRWRPPSDAGG
ncbi:hypothetical protein L1887_59210 [Cichorium endivia]|nr:hypothetical protein L1887_59210 [Cichorium endivia]